jgi:hypothetical protein
MSLCALIVIDAFMRALMVKHITPSSTQVWPQSVRLVGRGADDKLNVTERCFISRRMASLLKRREPLRKSNPSVDG